MDRQEKLSDIISRLQKIDIDTWDPQQAKDGMVWALKEAQQADPPFLAADMECCRKLLQLRKELSSSNVGTRATPEAVTDQILVEEAISIVVRWLVARSIFEDEDALEVIGVG